MDYEKIEKELDRLSRMILVETDPYKKTYLIEKQLHFEKVYYDRKIADCYDIIGKSNDADETISAMNSLEKYQKLRELVVKQQKAREM